MRVKKNPSPSPTPEEIVALRKRHRLSQTLLGEISHSGLRTVQYWEAGEAEMHPGLWELVRIKTDEHTPKKYI
jgi:DNA-binding transcriptional regulator YiaG